MSDSMNKKKLICVIGAGAAGIGSIKGCLESGFDVICYEKTNNTCGLWRYNEDIVDGVASVMESTIINSSKEMSSLTDFPCPDHLPNYMSHRQFCGYLESYVDHFNLRKHIKFNHVVTSIAKSDDHDLTGSWIVTSESLITKARTSITFDVVMVCTGHHVKPLVPKFEGQELFKGTIIHSHDYRNNSSFKNKNVAVVGVGNSGGDVAVDVSFVSSNTYLSTRRGCWILKRTGNGGEPGDCQNLKRCWNWFIDVHPSMLINFFVELIYNNYFDHEMYGLKPSHGPMSQHPMVNDFMANRLVSGSVKIVKNIKRFTENGIIFEGNDFETQVDSVVLCTGYSFSFPFITDTNILNYDSSKNIVDLYKFMINPRLKFPETMCFIGLFQTIGAGFPAGEMQIRYFMEILKGKLKLPEKEQMLLDILNRRKYRQTRFTDSVRHEHQVDWINFMDEIGDLFGAKPNLLKIFFTDPVLWYHLVFGPCLPFQYRLNGPGANYEKSRELILNYKHRMSAPFKSMVNNVENRVNDVNNNSFEKNSFAGDYNEDNKWTKMVINNETSTKKVN